MYVFIKKCRSYQKLFSLIVPILSEMPCGVGRDTPGGLN